MSERDRDDRDRPSELFRDDYFWMQRERKGLLPWADHNRWELLRAVAGYFHHDPICFHLREDDAPSLVAYFLREQIHENALFDLFVKALVRAEIRLISRYVPQRSHEERLTGNLVSEIDAAIHLVKDAFRRAAYKRYGETKDIDFFYFDLSRGGLLEKKTGADLAFIVVVDLPDQPFRVRSLVLQAKKADPSPRVDLAQHKTLVGRWKEAAYYLLYDMQIQRRTSPLVRKAEDWPSDNDLKKAEASAQRTLTLDFEQGLGSTTPLSLFLFDDVVRKGAGGTHGSFEGAVNQFLQAAGVHEDQPSRLAVVSLGKPISLRTEDGELRVSL